MFRSTIRRGRQVLGGNQLRSRLRLSGTSNDVLELMTGHSRDSRVQRGQNPNRVDDSLDIAFRPRLLKSKTTRHLCEKKYDAVARSGKLQMSRNVQTNVER